MKQILNKRIIKYTGRIVWGLIGTLSFWDGKNGVYNTYNAPLSEISKEIEEDVNDERFKS